MNTQSNAKKTENTGGGYTVALLKIPLLWYCHDGRLMLAFFTHSRYYAEPIPIAKSISAPCDGGRSAGARPGCPHR